jgi:hypothetical protein
VNELSALFSYDSSIAYALLKAGQCKLRFAEGSIEHQATYWHNHLFNPALPGKVRVLAFTPRL